MKWETSGARLRVEPPAEHMTADFIVNALRLLKAKGLALPEAVRRFSDDQLHNALFDGTGSMTPDQRALLDELASATAEECNERDLGDAIELWLAGWTHEPVTLESRIMSWYWRAPAKGKRPKGRLYRSTQQAVNALRRSQSLG